MVTKKNKTPDVVGHRGFSGKYPENTLISYENAIVANANGIEGDIRLTKDKEIIMMHDTKLDRTTTGSGPIVDANWHGYIDGLRTKPGSPERIPRFRDVLDLLVTKSVKDKNIYMIVDIKFDNPIEIMTHLHEILESEDYAEHRQYLERTLIIGIWNTEFLAVAEDLFKNYKLCFIGISVAAARKHFLQKVDYLSLPFAALVDEDGQRFIQEVQALNKKMVTWTINLVEQMRTCVIWNVDIVIGDHVTTMIKYIQHDVESLTAEEYKVFADSNAYLSPIHRRLYYYCIKTLMHYASRQFIGL